MNHHQSLCFLLVVSQSYSYQRAHTLSSYGQLTTSSSLGWVEVGRLREERLVMREGSGVCRQRRGGEVEAGSLSVGQCWLVQGGRLEAEFEVLVDMYGLARLDWSYWDMFTGVSVGSVSYHRETYVASLTSNSTTLVGDMSLARGLSGDISAWATNQTVFSSSGRVLVEMEPVRYQIEELRLGDRRVESSDRVTCETSTTVTSRTESDMVTADIKFTWNTTKYWGHVDGLVRGLPVTVEGQHYVWGVGRELTNTNTHTITRHLRPGQELKVTTSLTLVTSATPYTGLVTAIYRDGTTSRHHIKAQLRETVLTRVSHTAGGQEDVLEARPVTTSTTSTTSSTTSATRLWKSKTTPAWRSRKIFKKSLQSANLIESRNSFRPQSYKDNPLKIFYPDTDDVRIDNLEAEKNISFKFSSINLKLSFSLLFVLQICDYQKYIL